MKNWKGLVTFIILISSLVILAGVTRGSLDNNRTRQFVASPNLPALAAEARPTYNEAFTELKVEVLREAPSGSIRELGDSQEFEANYIGWLAVNGEIFDQALSTDGIKGTGKLNSASLIQGFKEGIAGMKLGEIRRIFIPASLGYADKEQGSIPANSDLVFDVELIWF